MNLIILYILLFLAYTSAYVLIIIKRSKLEKSFESPDIIYGTISSYYKKDTIYFLKVETTDGTIETIYNSSMFYTIRRRSLLSLVFILFLISEQNVPKIGDSIKLKFENSTYINNYFIVKLKLLESFFGIIFIVGIYITILLIILSIAILH